MKSEGITICSFCITIMVFTEICCSISVNVAQGGNKHISASLDFSTLSNFIMHANQAFLVMNKEKVGDLLHVAT